jgi:diaminohydroxyphosphoribosylaminopyrimidine deaminase / 5-amino-6-(5-phosphoribosylamino)uracil reductase
VHALRGVVDAVIVGTGTVVADDPSLTVRDDSGAPVPGAQPLRVVVGRREVPSGARVLDGAAATVVIASHDPHEVVAELDERGRHHVLLEGGPTLAAAFCRAGVVDRVVAYVAPVLLGDGPSAVGGLGITTIDGALRLEVEDVSTFGPDVRITARPAAPTPVPSPPAPDTEGR